MCSRTEAMWNIARQPGESGLRFINWWATWPRRSISGEMVSNHYPKPKGNTLEEVTYPPALARGARAPSGNRARRGRDVSCTGAGIPFYAPEVAEATFRPFRELPAGVSGLGGAFR